MVKLSEIIQEGWPNHKQSVSKQISEFWAFRDEQVVIDGLIFKGVAIVVPQASWKDILSQIHEGHLGIKRSKLHARNLVFWPGMTKQIKDMVSNCSTCQELRLSNLREPIIPHEIPQYPWQIVATDLFAWNGGNYIVIVDYYSRYWDIASLRSMTSTAVIAKKSISCLVGTTQYASSQPQVTSTIIHGKTFALNSTMHYESSNS